MKLLTQSGLLYSAVQAQTVDGHYGAFPEIDWSVQFDETLSAPGTDTGTGASVGLNPSIRQIETTFDGGKLISGNGYYSGTTTFAWIIKMFGSTACGSAVVAVPTGYVIWTDYVVASASLANCIAGGAWIWTPVYTTATDSLKRSTLVTDAAEDWKNGTLVDAGANYGANTFINVVGGVNAMESYGMGRWNIQIWAVSSLGLAMTDIIFSGNATATGATASNNPNAVAGQGNILFSNTATATVAAAGNAALSTVTQNACGTTIAPFYQTHVATDSNSAATAQLVSGYLMSATGCDQYIADEMNISGTYFFDRYADAKYSDKSLTGPAPFNTITGSAANGSFLIWAAQGTVPKDGLTALTVNDKAVYNYGAPKQVEAIYKTVVPLFAYLILFSAPETYGPSYIVGHYDANAVAVADLMKSEVAANVTLTASDTYGQINNFYLFSPIANASLTEGLWSTTDVNHDSLIFCGTHLGKGMVAALQLAVATTGAAGAQKTSANLTATNLLNDANTGVSYMNNVNVREIRSPAGGVMQFKGLTQSTTNDQYVEVICRRVEAHFEQTAWTDIANLVLTTGTSGFIVSCMTGISQCVMDNIVTSSTQATTSLLTIAEVAACQLDPRYLTWRQMTVQMDFGGTVIWYRTDSMWQRSSTVVSSSWGPGVTNSAHWESSTDNDNITAADYGKSYVFALADGSGIQLSHLTGGTSKVVAPTTNTTAGTGANALTTAETAFTNSFPNRVDDTQNICSTTNLLLSGLADTSSLATTVTAYSDGYLATITMALDWFQAGAAGGWRGVCMVYYTSQYIQDDTNGAVCMAAVQATTGPADLSGVFLIHIAASTWQPPAATGAVAPASLALTDAKYGIVTAPSATSYLYTGGYYASAAWYQPKYASSYADIARFGKDRYTGSYCMQGSGSTSYFTAPAAGIQLASAVKLAAGAIAMGSALLAM